MTTYYKCLTADGRGPYSGVEWHLPTPQEDGSHKPGKWMPRLTGELIRCEYGYHACTREQLVRWLRESIYEVELDGNVIAEDDKAYARRARLLRPLERWNERTARLFACDCAEAVLPIYEKHHPDDDRPRKCTEMARRYANGEATDDELAAARSAAYWAAYSAARSAADSAARSAADSAAYSAARSAAYSAARSAADSAAYSAADSAADSAAQAEQTTVLFDYLEGRRG